MTPSPLSRLLSLTTRSVIAHRGGSRLRPENTLTAFMHAITLGAHAIECDVHLSKDGEPVVIHDATLDRTTDATGSVHDYTATALARVDAGARFVENGETPYRDRGIGIPRLAEILGLTPVLPVVIELKGDDPALVDPVIAVVEEARARDRVIFGGFSRRLLDAVRARGHGVPTSACSAEVQSALRRSFFLLSPSRPRFEVFQVPVRLRGRRVLTRTFVRAARWASIPVHAWVVDEDAEMRRLLSWGVTGLISDRPDIALRTISVQDGPHAG
jgi:glycerophosphoryl diester phosphodiesterase